jgi:hypothetical protein
MWLCLYFNMCCPDPSRKFLESELDFFSHANVE